MNTPIGSGQTFAMSKTDDVSDGYHTFGELLDHRTFIDSHSIV